MRWTAEILDSVKTEYGSRLRFLTLGQLGEVLIRRSTSVEQPVRDETPGLELLHAYPNPFNPETTIGWRQREAGPVRLVVFDQTGREITILTASAYPAGEHRIRFNAAGLASGTYLVRIDSPAGTATRLLTLIR